MHPILLHRDYLAQRSTAAVKNPNGINTRDGVLRRWLRSAIRNWKRRKMIAALQAMDNRLLNDIGIYRNDIERVVDGFDARELGMAPVAPSKAEVIEN